MGDSLPSPDSEEYLAAGLADAPENLEIIRLDDCTTTLIQWEKPIQTGGLDIVGYLVF
jgi:hypothetical protein